MFDFQMDYNDLEIGIFKLIIIKFVYIKKCLDFNGEIEFKANISSY